jgi:hypothetical protein
MVVKCLSTYPDAEQLSRLGDHFYRRQTFVLEIGKEYLVLGIDFYVNDSAWGSGVYVEYLDEAGEGPVGLILRAPICLFDTVDGRPSKYWVASKHDNKAWSLKPPSFYREFYYDDFSESIPDIVEDFIRVYSLLESEYGDQG